MKFNWELTKMLEAHLIPTQVTFENGILESHKKEVQNIIDNYFCE